MSTQVFPTLPGLTYSVSRTHEWSNAIQQSVSGKETRIAYWNDARYTWGMQFTFLRSSTTWNEFQSLWGFVSARKGRYDSFLYTDATDNSVTGQAIGTGDSTATVFPMYRTFGTSGQAEVVLAPNSVTRVVVAGSSISSTQFSIAYWGSTNPGTITFSTYAPTNGDAISADFTYYFPCRFDDDVASFENFMYGLWENKKVIFRSIK